MGFLLKYCGLTSCLFLRAEEAELKATRSMSDNTSSFTFDFYSSSASYIVTKTFIILPISIIVLYLGYQRWQRQQRSFAAMSHSDIFTYNVTIVELIFVLGATLVIFGWWSNNFVAVFMGMSAITISYPGEMLLGCSSPHHLSGAETIRWCQDQKYLHWVCLVVVLWVRWSSSFLLP